MVNPGTFQGSQKEFLLGERPSYSTGVAGGYAADVLALIQQRYFKQYPLDLPHTVEPSAEFLAAVDDDAAEVDITEPDQDRMSNEEYEEAINQLAERQKLFSYHKAVSRALFTSNATVLTYQLQQIKRWLAYQHMKAQDLDPKESGAQDPYRILLSRLIGTSAQRPRLKSTVNVWRKTVQAEIDAVVKQKGDIPRAHMAKHCDQVVREMFLKLSVEEREQWAEQVKEEHEEALRTWKHETEGKLSMAPEDRQR